MARSRSSNPRSEMTIEAIELAKSFGSRPAIESISFKIGPGTIAGLLGVNGAGAMAPDNHGTQTARELEEAMRGAFKRLRLLRRR